MGILLSCCDDLNVTEKRRQFEKAIPVLLHSLAKEVDAHRLALFIAELIECVKGAELELGPNQAIRLVEKTVAVTCKKFEQAPNEHETLEEMLDMADLIPKTRKQRELEEKRKREEPKGPKPEEKLEDGWFEAVEMVKHNFLPDRKRTNLIANWILYDRDASGDLSFGELRRLLHALNFDDNTTSFILSKVSLLRKPELNFFEFDAIFQELLKFPELEDCWQSVAGWQDVGDDDFAGMMIDDDDDEEEDDDDALALVRGGGASSRRSKSQQQRLREQKAAALKEKHRQKYQTVDINDFVEFLVQTQKESPLTARHHAEQIIAQLGGTLDKPAFIRYLTSPEINNIYDAEKTKKVHMDMSQPICAYFINSSHNTYLTGNQLSSNSDADMYRRTLREGCRSVEIDCWDGPFGKPIVYHGFTRTSKISFESVVRAIDDSAFAHGNPFPVTISFELHVSIEQQNYMVDTMLRIWGNKLARPNWAPGKKPTKTVSPNNYRNKILVKSARYVPKPVDPEQNNKNKNSANSNSNGQQQQQQQEEEELDPNDPWSKVKLPAPPPKPKPKNAAAGSGGLGGGGGDDSSSSDDEGDTAEKRALQKAIQQMQDDPLQEIKKVKSSISPRLSDLVMIEACRIPKLTEQTFQKCQQCTVTSFSENRSRRMVKSQLELYRKLNRRQITRIYPHAARFNSSNFHPQEHWNVGCHMVAMNWQTEDYKTRYAKARFMIDNGNCGYLLKPPYLRSGAEAQPTKDTPGVLLTVRVLSAFALPKPLGSSAASEIIDPYVTVFCEGPFCGGENGRKLKTTVIDDNGFHPVWKGTGSELHTFKVPVPEMSTLVFQVWDEDVQSDDFIAEAFVPVHEVRSGIRCVAVANEKMKALPNTFIMVHVSAEDQRTGGQPLVPGQTSAQIQQLLKQQLLLQQQQQHEQLLAAAAGGGAPGAAAAVAAPSSSAGVPMGATGHQIMIPAAAPAGVPTAGAAGPGVVPNLQLQQQHPPRATGGAAVDGNGMYDRSGTSPRTVEWVDETLRDGNVSPDARRPQQQQQQQKLSDLTHQLEALFSHPAAAHPHTPPSSSAAAVLPRQAPASSGAVAAATVTPTAAAADATAPSPSAKRKARTIVTSKVTRLVEPAVKKSRTKGAAGGTGDGDGDNSVAVPLLHAAAATTTEPLQPLPASSSASPPKRSKKNRAADAAAATSAAVKNKKPEDAVQEGRECGTDGKKNKKKASSSGDGQGANAGGITRTANIADIGAGIDALYSTPSKRHAP